MTRGPIHQIGVIIALFVHVSDFVALYTNYSVVLIIVGYENDHHILLPTTLLND